LRFTFSWRFKWSHFIKKIGNSFIEVGEAGIGVNSDVTYIFPAGVVQLLSKFSYRWTHGQMDSWTDAQANVIHGKNTWMDEQRSEAGL
jgi:hypothetical protein